MNGFEWLTKDGIIKALDRFDSDVVYLNPKKNKIVRRKYIAAWNPSIERAVYVTGLSTDENETTVKSVKKLLEFCPAVEITKVELLRHLKGKLKGKLKGSAFVEAQWPLMAEWLADRKWENISVCLKKDYLKNQEELALFWKKRRQLREQVILIKERLQNQGFIKGTSFIVRNQRTVIQYNAIKEKLEESAGVTALHIGDHGDQDVVFQFNTCEETRKAVEKLKETTLFPEKYIPMMLEGEEEERTWLEVILPSLEAKMKEGKKKKRKQNKQEAEGTRKKRKTSHPQKNLERFCSKIKNNLVDKCRVKWFVGDEECAKIAKALAMTTVLKSLRLNQKAFGNVGCQYLASSIRVNSSLMELGLVENKNVDKTGMKFIGDSLLERNLPLKLNLTNEHSAYFRHNFDFKTFVEGRRSRWIRVEPRGFSLKLNYALKLLCISRILHLSDTCLPNEMLFAILLFFLPQETRSEGWVRKVVDYSATRENLRGGKTIMDFVFSVFV